jgi:cell division protein FtsA
LRVPVQRAREILTELGTVGSAIMQPDGHTRLLPVETVPGHPPRNIPVSSVERIVEMRLQELFTVILADLQKQDMLKRIGWGIKLAGGGAAIPRITDLAQMVFEMPVEIGLPALVNGPKQILDSPRYATPIGILRYGRQTQPLYDQADSSFGRVLRREIRRLLRVVLRQAPVQW